ncbi:MAG: transcription-repair coupling factor [Actinobacteria bacterium]|nr:transcription-repair coupling factor [Actinomycetota bacterium]
MHPPTPVSGGPLAGLLVPGRQQLADVLGEGTLVAGPAVRPYLLALLAERSPPLVVVTARVSDAESLTDALSTFLGADRVALFPPWETLPHERLSPQPATVGQRLAVLDRLVRPDADAHPGRLLAVVAPIRAALQPMDPKLGDRAPLTVDAHYRGFDALIEMLVELGYDRVEQVHTRGDFAVRGGIVDVFPTAGAQAVRIEFWGDDVESLRTFAVGDQRSTGPAATVRIDPARELVVDAEIRQRARQLATAFPSIADRLHQLADGLMFEGVESLVTLLHPRLKLLPEFAPAGGVAIVDPILVRERASKLRDEAEALLEIAWETAAGHRPVDAGYVDLELFVDRAPGPTWELTPFAARPGATTPLEAEPWESFRGDIAAVADRLGKVAVDGHRIVATAGGHGPAQRLSQILAEEGVPVGLVDTVAEDDPGRAEVVASTLREGFFSANLGVAVLGEYDVFGVRRSRAASRRLGTRATAHEAVLDLEPGDYVVHRTHGVGRYRGMQTRQVPTPSGALAARDYVVLDYAKGDALFVPSDQVDAITRYAGADQPTVMRMGGAEWERAKRRVRGAVRDVAAELIRLYTARLHAPGTTFSPDGEWQRELEDAFEHVETADQLVVVDEIKRDMEAPLPMDRLLTGDVGFGKTEVAIRAAAKAAFDGKQVAVLVPTTLLAQQHLETFRERLTGFPVDVRMLSRFVSSAERRAVLDGLAAGTIDVVIGTHVLLGGHVRFKDLGLVIVDEEQRFGVRHKERLKQLRTSVDVLSMSATPIPRTLEMAISGIRDLSVIETPPEDRQPVHTVVAPYDDAQVALAVRRELLREGQVFYVHNQIATIGQAAARLRELVPDARVEMAHGQTPEDQLERVMVRFWEREFDVLLCTTIIESGLDVPNANTLIIERADLLGLAQLHQLRGRVGRATERGYAYLFFPPDGAAITEGAYQRLQTVGEHARLGSGLAIALRDLELRGAGNVVGAEQSGHVAAVGFDTYTEMLKHEVADLTGQPIEEEIEVKLELPVDAHLPDGFVPDEKLRLDLYRRIAAVGDAAGVKALREELADRFGRLPPPAERLLNVAALKAALRRWGITEVVLLGGAATAGPARRVLRASPVHLTDSQQVRLQRLHPRARWRSTAEVLEVPFPPDVDDIVAWVAATLRDVLGAPGR